MKKLFFEFLRRGVSACGLGPIILAVLYLILQQQGLLETLTVNEVCLGIFSLTAVAFIAGAMNAIYQIERLPLMLAILIHGAVLYLSYLATYLLNGWLASGFLSILVFSAIFAIGYPTIWAIIYSFIKHKTDRINAMLKQKQQSTGEME